MIKWLTIWVDKHFLQLENLSLNSRVIEDGPIKPIVLWQQFLLNVDHFPYCKDFNHSVGIFYEPGILEVLGYDDKQNGHGPFFTVYMI